MGSGRGLGDPGLTVVALVLLGSRRHGGARGVFGGGGSACRPYRLPHSQSWQSGSR